jgi:hypothetical protein
LGDAFAFFFFGAAFFFFCGDGFVFFGEGFFFATIFGEGFGFGFGFGFGDAAFVAATSTLATAGIVFAAAAELAATLRRFADVALAEPTTARPPSAVFCRRRFVAPAGAAGGAAGGAAAAAAAAVAAFGFAFTFAFGFDAPPPPKKLRMSILLNLVRETRGAGRAAGTGRRAGQRRRSWRVYCDGGEDVSRTIDSKFKQFLFHLI